MPAGSFMWKRRPRLKLSLTDYGIVEELTIDLTPGLTVLVGPNGSGKSTIVDALYFVLTGETIDGRNVVDRINWGAVDRKAVVSLTSCDFSITRTIKSTGVSHKLTLPDGTMLTKKGDINDRLFSMFNIENSGVIKDVFFSAQLRATDLFDATESQRLALLSRVFGFDRLEQCRSAIYKVLAETSVPTVNAEALTLLKSRLDLLNQDLTKLNEDKASVDQSLDKLQFDADRYLEIVNTPTDAERATHEDARNSALVEIGDTNDEDADLRHKAEDAEYVGRALKAVVQYNTDVKEKIRLEEELAGLSSGISLDGLNKAREDITVRRVSLEKEIAELKSRASGETAVCPLTGGTPCIDLLRKLDPELIKQEINAKQEALDVVNSDAEQLDSYIQQAVAAEKRRGSLETQLNQLQAAIDASRQVLSEFDHVEGDLEASLTKQLEDIGFTGDVEKRYQELSERRKTLHGLFDFHQKWLDAHPDAGSVSNEERASWQIRKQEFDRLHSEASRLESEISVKQATVDGESKILAKMIEDQRVAENFQHRAEILRDVREILSKGQLQKLLLQTTLNRVNTEIDACAKVFNFPYKLFIEESGAVSFSNDDIGKADVKLLSGGQKYVAAIITRLAFARVLQARFPFIVLDEPSTCLDDHSRELLSGLLASLSNRSKQERTYMLVPTHDEMLLAVADKSVMTK